MTRVGLIGDPVAHSLSPVMHNAAFAEIGINATYELWHTPASGLAGRVDGLRQAGTLGANVTVPHKQAVPHLCDDVSQAARQIGAVNTIVSRDGRLHGDNTDAYGFMRALDGLPKPSGGGSALILGAGGAARAVAVALSTAGVDAISIANRTPGRATDLVAALHETGLAGIQTTAWNDLVAALPDATLLINATSLGWHHDETPIPVEYLDNLPPDACVFDLTYRDTALIRAARDRGFIVSDGLDMLIYQGARALELWTGLTAPVEVMRLAVVSEQRHRG